MKIILFSLLCLILIGMISYSYAQFTVVDKNTRLPEVLLQIEVRDSNGSLVAYIETERIAKISNLELNMYLDIQNQTHIEFLIKDDKKYELQQFQTTMKTHDEKLAYSSTSLVTVIQNELVTLLLMSYDTYLSQPGDTVRHFWTIIRPLI